MSFAGGWSRLGGVDDIAGYNRERWARLVRARAVFSRPKLALNPESARAYLDPVGVLDDTAGRRVLCLAGGGGQQSVAFALLGAEVTVFDLSPDQLRRDREAAAHHGVPVTTVVGDMRDLSSLAAASFDIVWQPYSLNFVPDARQVFRQVARVIRPGGLYHVMSANPFAAGITTGDWTGTGYLLRRRYADGAEVEYPDEAWVYDRDTAGAPIPGPREYLHTLGTLLNGLAEAGFVIVRLTEATATVQDPAPGTWEHLQSVVPPWLTWWTRYRPDMMAAGRG